jgi:hypothetical protein
VKSLYFEVQPLDHPPGGGTFFVAWMDKEDRIWQNVHPDRQRFKMRRDDAVGGGANRKKGAPLKTQLRSQRRGRPYAE